MTSDAPRPHHLIVFGATGLTARRTVEELLHGPSARWPTNFSWAIAGRNRAALDTLRLSLSGDGAPLPDVVVADVGDEASLVAMARQTKLLLNCVGPYREYGEPVVKACIDARTDYLDLSGEPGFIERMHLLYHDAAVKADITIVHAAAFDSVPCDLGVLLCKKLLADRGAYPSSIEMFFSLKVNKSLYKSMNYATYESAIKGFATVDALRAGRKELARVRPKPVPVGPPINTKGHGILGRFGIRRDPRVNGWLVPYFFSDPAVVRLTQALTLHLTNPTGTPPPNAAPVHFAAYIQVPTLRALVTFLFYFIVFQFLAVRSWGRILLYRYPELFTGGLASRNLGKKSSDDISFTQTFFARGYSAALHPTPVNTPDTTVAVRITGPEPGYYSTSIIFLEAASVVLARRNALPKGVLTPAVAFGGLEKFEPDGDLKSNEGGVMDALQRNGKVTWSITKA